MARVEKDTVCPVCMEKCRLEIHGEPASRLSSINMTSKGSVNIEESIKPTKVCMDIGSGVYIHD